MGRRAAVAAAVLALMAGACSGAADDGAAGDADAPAPEATVPAGDALGGFRPSAAEWRECGDGVECAQLAVPRDYDEPAGPTLQLGLVRVLASDPDRRIGTLLTNPGGPGAAGLGFAVGAPFSEEVRSRFDVVGFDPRGVGESTPLTCGADPSGLLELDPSPDDDAEQTALDAAAIAVAEDCAERDGDLLPHVGTDDVARDLEAIRLALGGEQLSYVGFSYGTLIALRYLDLFPDGARALVLDGVVDPTNGLTGLLRGQTRAFDTALDAALAACPDGGDGCPEGGAAVAYDRVTAAAEVAPLPASDGEVAGPAEVASAAVFATYDDASWSSLHQALVAADEQGDGTGLRALAGSYRGFGSFGLYQAVSCLDSERPTGGEAWAAFADELEALSPRLGASIANEMLACAHWPVPPAPVTGPVDGEGGPPVVLVGTTGDPATPLANAEAVAEGLVDGHLVVHDAAGHTSYGSSACVREAVDTYLLALVVPRPGLICTD